MNVISVPQIQMHIPIAAALAFSSSWVRGASLAYSTKPLSEIPLLWIPEQIFLYLAQHLVGRQTCELMEPSRKCLRFYEYHTVVYTTL